jgi:hypothetical protein
MGIDIGLNVGDIRHLTLTSVFLISETNMKYVDWKLSFRYKKCSDIDIRVLPISNIYKKNWHQPDLNSRPLKRPEPWALWDASNHQLRGPEHRGSHRVIISNIDTQANIVIHSLVIYPFAKKHTCRIQLYIDTASFGRYSCGQTTSRYSKEKQPKKQEENLSPWSLYCG